MNTKLLGNQGESLAADYLVQRGCTILARNFRMRAAELDLVARDGDTIAFIEVKTRKSTRFGTAAEAVDYRKQQKIIQAARYFLQQRRLEDCFCRFDVIEVYAGEANKIRHIKGAFEA